MFTAHVRAGPAQGTESCEADPCILGGGTRSLEAQGHAVVLTDIVWTAFVWQPNDFRGVRAHALAEWRLEPPP